MARLLKHPSTADTKLICGGLANIEIPVHSSIITARSNVLAEMLSPVSISPIKTDLESGKDEEQKGYKEVRHRRYSMPITKNF